jgi:hypothetical protein
MAKVKKQLASHKVKQAVKVAKKAAKSVSTKSKVSNIKEHVEKHSGERRDCSAIWTLIKHDSSKYKTDDEIINLIKSKGYETLLGEIS